MDTTIMDIPCKSVFTLLRERVREKYISDYAEICGLRPNVITHTLFCSTPGGDRGEKNLCVSCHKTLPTKTFVGRTSHEWEESIHSRGGITCEQCHGGNPLQEDKDLAHVDVLVSADPKSRIHFKKVPETCGNCHKIEYLKFMKSLHYAYLEKAGKNQSNIEKAQVTLKKAEGNIDIVKKAWHSFELQNIKKMAKEAFDLSVKAKEEVFKPKEGARGQSKSTLL